VSILSGQALRTEEKKMAQSTGKIHSSSEAAGKESLSEYVRDYLGNPKEVANEVLETVSDKTREFADKAKDVAKHTGKNVSKYIESNPTQSFFVGLGVGCLIGFTVTSLFRK
jgi:ElaB/YqjD/DUF883 family membrane-anchored ribosome-binding protein